MDIYAIKWMEDSRKANEESLNEYRRKKAWEKNLTQI